MRRRPRMRERVELRQLRVVRVQRLRETAFLTKGLHIKLVDERAEGKTVEFHYEGGIKDFVAYINDAKDPIHKHIVYFEGTNDQGQVEVVIFAGTDPKAPAPSAGKGLDDPPARDIPADRRLRDLRGSDHRQGR